jgi:hypothetical protein
VSTEAALTSSVTSYTSETLQSGPETAAPKSVKAHSATAPRPLLQVVLREIFYEIDPSKSGISRLFVNNNNVANKFGAAEATAMEDGTILLDWTLGRDPSMVSTASLRYHLHSKI